MRDLHDKCANELLVLIEEELGYRYWFWFPHVSRYELEHIWESMNAGDFWAWFKPVETQLTSEPLPGERVEVKTDHQHKLFNRMLESGKHYFINEWQGQLITPEGAVVEWKES